MMNVQSDESVPSICNMKEHGCSNKPILTGKDPNAKFNLASDVGRS